MVRHIRGGHVAIPIQGGTPITEGQIDQAKKQAGERFMCSKCFKWFERKGLRDEHMEECQGR